MKFVHESELMKNQKNAQALTPDGDSDFDVVQASNGDALFFFISTGVLYVTREIRENKTGWNKIDLSSALTAQHRGAKVKSFALDQNPHTLSFDIALVLSASDGDLLFLSFGNSSVPDKWPTLHWTPAPFNAKDIDPPAHFSILDVHLMNIPSADFGPQLCFIDTINAVRTDVIARYYIQNGSPPQWHRHALPTGLLINSNISTCVGHPHNSKPGTYTLGGTPAALTFTPVHDTQPIPLEVPDLSRSISSTLDRNGHTNLFIAADSGLYLFTPDNHPVLVVSNDNDIFSSAMIVASTVRHRTSVWGLNDQHQLFLTSCPAGREDDPSSWSYPVPISNSVTDFAFYLNVNTVNNVVFVFSAQGKLLQLTKDPVTTFWSQRHILLPHNDPKNDSKKEPIEYHSYTTHIQVTDDNGFNATHTNVQITSSSPVTVYINDVYYVLTPTVAVHATTDATGAITIIQETQSLTAASFRITLSDHPTTFADIDPLSKAKKTLKTIDTGDDLGKIQITTADGKSQPLVPSTVSSKRKSDAVGSLKKLMKASAKLPKDGSAKSSGESSFNYEDTVSLVGQDDFLNSDTLLWPNFFVDAGDLFHWFKHKAHEVESDFRHAVHDVEGVIHVVIKFAGAVYRGALKTVTAIVGAVEFVFRKIEVAFEHMVAWLGFLLHWEDIKWTHLVIKNFLKQSAWRIPREIENLETDVKHFFDNLREHLDKWADIPDTGGPIGATHRNSHTVHGSHSPQSHWALYHAKNNLSNASSSFEPPNTDVVEQIIQKLGELVHEEVEEVKKVVQEIKTQIADVIESLTLVQIVKKLSAIIGDLILDSAKDIVVTVLEIIRILVTSVLELLDAPIDIPVLSYVYHEISGDNLTILDLVCFIGAIPVTIIFKLGPLHAAPFPETDHTKALVKAKDFATIVELLTDTEHSAVSGVQEDPLGEGKSLTMTQSKGNIMAIALNFLSAFSSPFVIINSMILRVGPSTAASACLVVANLAYVSPNFVAWKPSVSRAFDENTFITCLWVGKVFVDAFLSIQRVEGWTNFISPLVEGYLNSVWLVPAIDSFVTSPKGPVDNATLAANLAFDISGILTPLTIASLFPEQPEFPEVVFLYIQFLTGVAGRFYALVGVEESESSVKRG